ncbi:lipid A biosynthesis acyltransferase [Rhodobacteraceae bacterium RKSG542]|uniref:lysophospholipid acyltransferase family protein n=1 Tax=Pseudovibrio flavus TaxID=2529854 RepID=UPI0012BD4887|nr:lipid A biosynthesis acyltransferase [Pseudovibrio flavus]MTI17549.1 lipid A biosynthesis acyltransferase [Pseudovibrio flavus]
MKTAKSIAHTLEYAALVSASALLHLLPLDTAAGFMGRAWRFIAPRTKRHPRARAHLMAAYPQMTMGEADAILYRMWDNLGRVSAETLLLDRFIKDPARVQLRNGAELEEMLNGANAVLVTMHGGNWELVSVPAARVGIELAGVYQALANPKSDEFLAKEREPLYKRGLFKKGHSTGKKLINVLRTGGSPCFVGDVRDKRGVEIEFFGQKASATHIPALLARNAGVPLIAIRAVRTHRSNFEIEAAPVTYPVTDDKRADAIAGTQALHSTFEKWIRQDPAQWMWIIRKWD